jgi:hypothetical protein
MLSSEEKETWGLRSLDTKDQYIMEGVCGPVSWMAPSTSVN